MGFLRSTISQLTWQRSSHGAPPGIASGHCSLGHTPCHAPKVKSSLHQENHKSIELQCKTFLILSTINVFCCIISCGTGVVLICMVHGESGVVRISKCPSNHVHFPCTILLLCSQALCSFILWCAEFPVCHICPAFIRFISLAEVMLNAFAVRVM